MPPCPAAHRCAQDMVEVPSHLWEHFAVDPETLSLLARSRGGDRTPLPKGAARQLVGARRRFSALELQSQVWTVCEGGW
eukprot:366244-Chlamydomonas_euryale.AAC.1